MSNDQVSSDSNEVIDDNTILVTNLAAVDHRDDDCDCVEED